MLYFGGARRDEEKIKKKRIYSFRDKNHRWDPKSQRPELWNIYMEDTQKVSLLEYSHYLTGQNLIFGNIFLENISIPDLYFQKREKLLNIWELKSW